MMRTMHSEELSCELEQRITARIPAPMQRLAGVLARVHGRSYKAVPTPCEAIPNLLCVCAIQKSERHEMA